MLRKGFLPKLVASSSEDVLIQQTSLSLDTLARFTCNTFDEVIFSDNSQSPFDYIVIGSGMYGSYAASKLFRLSGDQKPRILVLDAGPFLLSNHIQNYSDSFGYSVFDAIKSKPYISNLPPNEIHDHYYCIGGKSLGWGKWCPRMTQNDLSQWPDEISDYLHANHEIVEVETGIKPTDEFIFGELHDRLTEKFCLSYSKVEGFTGVSQPPIAAQAQTPASGLFSFDAFSSVTLLLDAIREDINSTKDPIPEKRRLILIPKARAVKLNFLRSSVDGIQVIYGESQEEKYIDTKGAKIILALGASESTRLVLNSLPVENNSPDRLIGRNMMAHFRSNYDVRIHRSAFGSDLPMLLQASALHIQGEIRNRRFHIQFFAAADPGNSGSALLYKMVRDIEDLKALLDSQKSEWISFRVLTVGEMIGNKSSPLYTPGTSWMDVSPYEFDRYNDRLVSKTYVHWEITQEDDVFWQEMDKKALQLMLEVAGDTNLIEFRQEKDKDIWGNLIPENLRGFRDGLGTSYHESGTLWMGTDANTSVTNTSGRFHNYNNLYCVDQSIFPTVGSANPVLTGLVLTRKVVTDLLGGVVNEEPVLVERLTSILEQTNYKLKTLSLKSKGKSLIDLKTLNEEFIVKHDKLRKSTSFESTISNVDSDFKRINQDISLQALAKLALKTAEKVREIRKGNS